MTAHPTLLARLASSRHLTPKDAVIEFGATAKRLGTTYTPSERQWERWCAGTIKGLPRPLCRRVLEAMFGHTVTELFAPPPIVSNVSLVMSAGSTSEAYLGGAARASGSRFPSIDEEITLVAEESARFTRRVRRADEQALEQLDADVRRLAIDYLVRPPYFTFRRVAELRAEVFSILDARHPLNQERRLYLVAGQLCGLLAHASADLGHPNEADTHVRTALVCAELAGDNSLRAYSRWVQSNVAYWRGDYRQAADIANAGREHATSGTAMLRLTSQEARALAAARETAEFSRAIGVARDARDRQSDNDEPGVFRFGAGKAAYYASEAYCAMGSSGDLVLAKQQATESIQLLVDDSEGQIATELVAAARLDLAAAHLAAGETDGAAEHLGLVLAIAPEHRTVPVVQRVQRIERQLITSRSAVGEVAELGERISLFAAHPAVSPPSSIAPE